MARFGKFKKGQLKKLEVFAATHPGVEGYLEPRTATYEESLVLVARDGSWARSAVADRGQAAAFCKKLNVPFYDAAIVGYPERMKGTRGKPAAEAPTAAELEAWFSADQEGPEK